jgi:hypothetical protein
VTSPLTDHILRRLASTGADAHPWSFLVLAALEGDAALATYLAGEGVPVKPAAVAPAPAATAEPPGAFVGAVTVQGFRGVGPATTLPLHAGPGLTLVVGRNGSGKSSFAEGLELLLTGDNLRWKGRPLPWKLGWRNLHQADTTALSAELVVEGLGPLTATRTWAAGAELAASTAEVKAKGRAAVPFDALATVPGLDEFVAVQAGRHGTGQTDCRSDPGAPISPCLQSGLSTGSSCSRTRDDRGRGLTFRAA